MISIAIVEDEQQQIEQLSGFLNRYQTAAGRKLSIQTYTDGDELLYEFRPGKFDILLMDIQMKRVDGMTAAQKIRARDKAVIIIFITNIVQYAVKGYSVQAFDFIVKPIDYDAFAEKLEMAISRVHKQETTTVCLKLVSGFNIFNLDEIVCIEIISRKLFIHTIDNTYQCNGTLQGIEEALNDERFYRCHAGCLVNLQHVKKIESVDLLAGEKRIPVSRHRRKGLLDALAKYLSN
ncbi:MAG: response regulator transcription factor [Anaerolineales bacterium]|nr:response regulator transcription factor [Anaerolineales bacterium]